MRNVEAHLLGDKMDEAVTHYINTHQPSEHVHIDTDGMPITVQDDSSRITVMHQQTYSSHLLRQVSVSEPVGDGPWGEELLDPEGRIAAIVAHLANSRASHHPHSHHKVSVVRNDVDNSVILDSSIRFNGQPLDQQSVSLAGLPSMQTLPPLQEMKCEANWFTNKNKKDESQLSQLRESDGPVLELASGSPAQHRQHNRKSLPHKKRISRKLKRNGGCTPQQELVISSIEPVLAPSVEEEQILPDNYVTVQQPSHHITHEVRPIFICQICGDFYDEEQLKFFHHLKQHYEPHTTIIIDNPVSDLVMDKMTNTCIVDNVATLPDSIVELSLENSVPKTIYQPIDKHMPLNYNSMKVQYSMANVDKVSVPVETDKSDLYSSLEKLELYNCGKCTKTFRKQRQCEAHMRDAHPAHTKLEDMGEFSEPEDLMAGIHVCVGEYSPALLPHLTVDNGHVHQDHTRHWYSRNGSQEPCEECTDCNTSIYCAGCDRDHDPIHTTQNTHPSHTHPPHTTQSTHAHSPHDTGTNPIHNTHSTHDTHPHQTHDTHPHQTHDTHPHQTQDTQIPHVTHTSHVTEEQHASHSQHITTLDASPDTDHHNTNHDTHSHHGTRSQNDTHSQHDTHSQSDAHSQHDNHTQHDLSHTQHEPPPLKMLKEEVLQRIFDSEGPPQLSYNNMLPEHSSEHDEREHERKHPGEHKHDDDEHKMKADSASKTNEKRKRLECRSCGRVFSHRNSLMYHLLSHSERQHACSHCDKTFFTAAALKIHKRVHNGDKPYKCTLCGREFRQWSDLKYHTISLHSTEKQFKCDFCGKEFARKYSLNLHRRIHTGERNYKCDYCAKTFSASSYRLTHMRTHTGDRPYKCEECGKSFRSSFDLRRHSQIHDKYRNRLEELKPKNKDKKPKPVKEKDLPIPEKEKPSTPVFLKKGPKKKSPSKKEAPNITVQSHETPNARTDGPFKMDYADDEFDRPPPFTKFKIVYTDELNKPAVGDKPIDREGFAVFKQLYRETTDGKLQIFTHVEKAKDNSSVSNSQVMSDLRQEVGREVRDGNINGEENGFLERLTALYNVPA